MKTRQSVKLPAKLSTAKGRDRSMQGLWSGTISFSLVAIPVQLVKAIEPGHVSFRLLHSRDYSPLLRRMVCPKEEKEVPPEETIRGYEIGPDQYVLITDEELESLSPERSRTIEIVDFIDMKEVDPLYYDHPYYLVPLKGGEKSYRLLAEVMQRTNKAGLAKFVLGEREYLVAVKSIEGALSLITLHYADEILSAGDIAPPPETGIESDIQNRMEKIIGDMMVDFNPDKYANERRKKIMKLLRKKVKGQAPVEAPETGEEEGEGPVDLIAVLEESMRRLKEKR